MTKPRHSTTTNRSYLNLMAKVIENGGVECEQVPEIFFPEDEVQGRKSADDRRHAQLEIQIAKSICRRCPLNTECADYAIKAEEPYGIFGGLTPQERRQLKRLISQYDGEQAEIRQRSLQQ